MFSALGVCLLAFAVASSYAAVISHPLNCATTSCLVQTIAWFSQTSCIMITQDFKVWLSNDQGQNFTQVMKQYDWVIQYPQNPQTMFFIPTSSSNFTYTTNGGVSFVNSSLPTGQSFLGIFVPHPSQLGWLLVVSCTGQQKCTLYTSKNYGATWTTSFQSTISAISPFPLHGGALSLQTLI